VHEVLNFLKKRRENVQIFQALRWRFDIWETEHLEKGACNWNVRAICWIVPQKYLLLLDQTILLHFRSSIDRPLNLPEHPGSNNYFSAFDVIVTSWTLFVFCISWNLASDISTVFEDIKHLRSRAPEHIFPGY
jgi:hypothetical protein